VVVRGFREEEGGARHDHGMEKASMAVVLVDDGQTED
jgi:hypothetical protein